MAKPEKKVPPAKASNGSNGPGGSGGGIPCGQKCGNSFGSPVAKAMHERSSHLYGR